MAHYRLVSFKTSPWVQRVAIVLREKQLAFDLDHIESANRPDWLAQLSPHGKVPLLLIDETTVLFESNAIAEYLDETIAPRLHPEDSLQRAINRAWTDYVPTFSALLSGVYTAKSEDSLVAARDALAKSFSRIEDALGKKNDGPFFNGKAYGLVDAGYAPFLQRWAIVEAWTQDTLTHAYPKLQQWTQALIARPSTHSVPPEELRALFLQGLQRRGGFIATRATASV